jgi:hypothetical protein
MMHAAAINRRVLSDIYSGTICAIVIGIITTFQF